MTKLTPMMKQYFEIKDQYKDCILFYRLGDFYEMFYEDAKIASKELEITLTGKNCGQEERAPMCGVPYHACELYLNKLIEKGYKVAICEQVEDPAVAKGIVKREVIRIVTPGTNISLQSLEESRNNYIMSVFYEENGIGAAFCDVTTGEFKATQMKTLNELMDEINKFSPVEIICNEAFLISGIDLSFLKDKMGAIVYNIESYHFAEDSCEEIIKRQYHLGNIQGLGLSDYPYGMIASGALLSYLHETQKNSLNHLLPIVPYSNKGFMMIDSSTRRNLELCETMREKNKKGSLLWVLDKTKTAMGGRKLRSFVEQPLVDSVQIEERYDAVEALKNNMITREELREYLHPIYDLERLTTKISYRSANPRDLISFKTSVALLPPIKTLLSEFEDGILHRLYEDLDELTDLYELLEESIVEDPPIPIKEGGIMKEGYCSDLDLLRKAKTEGKVWLANLEEREREKTGIKNLKVKYNKVFGYYLEVTKSYQSLVPDYYIRKQTLANAERYTTEELDEIAGKVLGAEDKMVALEYELFVDIREKLAAQMHRVQKTAHVIAVLDAFCSLALVAEQNNYVRPVLNNRGIIDIKNGRHPVVEKMISNDMFVANDVYLDNKDHRVSIITGPNMAGKSTYMRQTALIVLMAQMGSFVPAKRAAIGVVDRIFTRVGASDDLASGQSTFMVEMSEVANILRNATKNSLIILDEIGRGTSTFDGLSIAWAVVEYISDARYLGAKTLFATHYHELTELEGKLSNVNNYCIAVKEQGDDIVFLRKIVKGGADKSYGVQVAKLAGVPDVVIERAKEIVRELSENDISGKARDIDVDPKIGESQPIQMSFFDQLSCPPENPVVEELKNLDLSRTTPIEALNLLYELQEKAKQNE
ncbi:MAG: DNA mismatch repair protein MutS [Lachnospiraceae bacterium]|nr:DNA mismatch repair protein MutS [Lachnospiraceae bacterium]